MFRHVTENYEYPPGNQHIPQKWHFEDDFPFPKVGYVNPLEGNINYMYIQWFLRLPPYKKNIRSQETVAAGMFGVPFCVQR